jgi:hypothetical protein
MEPLSLLLAKRLLLPNKWSPFGNGKKKTPVTSLPKWIKKLTVCKDSLSLIITNDNSPPLEKPESSSGFGKTLKEDFNFTHPKFLLKKPSLKLFLFQILPKQSQEPRKV